MVCHILGAEMCASLTKQQGLAAHTQPDAQPPTQPSQPAPTTLPSWPPPPLLPTGNMVHAPPSTRGASTALCALLPARSARHCLLQMLCMLQLLLRPRWWQRQFYLCCGHAVMPLPLPLCSCHCHHHRAAAAAATALPPSCRRRHAVAKLLPLLPLPSFSSSLSSLS